MAFDSQGREPLVSAPTPPEKSRSDGISVVSMPSPIRYAKRVSSTRFIHAFHPRVSSTRFIHAYHPRVSSTRFRFVPRIIRVDNTRVVGLYDANATAPPFIVRFANANQGLTPLAIQCHGSAVQLPTAWPFKNTRLRRSQPYGSAVHNHMAPPFKSIRLRRLNLHGFAVQIRLPLRLH